MPSISCFLNLEPIVETCHATGRKTAFVNFDLVDSNNKSVMPFDLVDLIDLDALLVSLPAITSGEDFLIATDPDYHREVRASKGCLTISGFLSDGTPSECQVEMTANDWATLEDIAQEAISLL